MAGVTPERARQRPLSPHLQIYRPQINMVMSILHRITGAALYVGSLLIAWWLIAAATSPEYFAFVNGLFATWPGMVVIVGYSWALIHHLLGGLRHFVWDTGAGLDIGSVDLLSWSTIVLSVLLTGALWLYIASERGWVQAWQ
ncbi:MAG: succinate dehydrogenase, cytochrome b556 subunit [Hyphomicrobium sp.]|uniref:succinate dehydrogenase, cytochrome b556 subunit n=1 Tax=Hyphomicrobium sp. TaxID=82 RepID=UPI00132BD383|nr:succinate dehydrogenase, cytochrome b556 subunit [Hyphomicrobium sp.]KAB2944156.1 MAG: succinate dehydrogenase, cytochrome b556 subunit [Hyphomicrobium sp.]MBZ0209513.1 succinate dehydrogenase, cytochrome b556 subunit [Hyphomicrobium sp.]